MKRAFNTFFTYVLAPVMGAVFLGQAMAGESPNFPKNGKDVGNFIPSGWYLESQISADLHGAGSVDKVVVVTDKAKSSSKTQDGNRILLLLLKNSNGYRLNGLGLKTLWCAQCYGTLGGASGGTPEIKVNNRVITIYQSGGDTEAVDITLKFRFESETGKFRLIGKDTIVRERASGNVQTISTNYLNNKKKIGDVTFDQDGKNEKIKDREEKISPVKLYVEDYDVENL